MDVRLSAEQRALRDSVAKVVTDLGPHAVGELDDEGRTAKLEAAVAAAGWRELRSGDDGPLASAVEVALVAEELSRGLADVAFAGPTLAAELRRRAGAPEPDEPETVALTSTLDELATAGADEGAIAVDRSGATTALVLLPAGDGTAVGRVPLDGTGVLADLTRPTAPVDLGRAEPLADQGRPLDRQDVTATTALGLALSCAELVGTMRGAVDLAAGYARERRQYGHPIGSFQAVQHLLADAFVAMEGSRSAALHAAWAVDALDPSDALGAAALAKAYAARAARSVCETAIQVHGGIGNTWECLAHVHLRRALLSADLFGGVGPSLERVRAHRQLGGARGLR